MSSVGSAQQHVAHNLGKLATRASRRGTQLDKRLLERPGRKRRLRMWWALRYLLVAVTLLGLAYTDWGHWLNFTCLGLSALWALSGWAMAPLRRARAYLDGWVDGHHELLEQLPLVLSGRTPAAQFHRVQLAAEMAARGMDPEHIFCELDDQVDDPVDDNER